VDVGGVAGEADPAGSEALGNAVGDVEVGLPDDRAPRCPRRQVGQEIVRRASDHPPGPILHADHEHPAIVEEKDVTLVALERWIEFQIVELPGFRVGGAIEGDIGGFSHPAARPVGAEEMVDLQPFGIAGALERHRHTLDLP
jgi:hypothetical protein